MRRRVGALYHHYSLAAKVHEGSTQEHTITMWVAGLGRAGGNAGRSRWDGRRRSLVEGKGGAEGVPRRHGGSYVQRMVLGTRDTPMKSGVVVRPGCAAVADGSAIVTIACRHVWRRSERQRREPHYLTACLAPTPYRHAQLHGIFSRLIGPWSLLPGPDTVLEAWLAQRAV